MSTKNLSSREYVNTFLPYVRARSGRPLNETCFPRKILLIDDNKRFCRKMKHAAMLRNSLLVYCRTMAEVTHLIEVDRFDLIIINDKLQGFFGRPVSQFLQTFFRDIPIILRTTIEPSGADDFLYGTATVYGHISQNLNASKTIAAIGQILVHRFGNVIKENKSGSPFSQAEYTEFCGKTRKGLMQDPMRKVMATIGKVLLANASLMMSSAKAKTGRTQRKDRSTSSAQVVSRYHSSSERNSSPSPFQDNCA